MSSSTSKAPAITPHLTMRGHTNWATGVVHLPSGRQIITCSVDGSLRLWDLECGAQIGEDWQDEDGRDKTNEEVWSIALSPNAKTVASGSSDGTLRLWDVETRKVIAKWTSHTNVVCILCWSADGKRVTSGSWDGTARVWDVKSGKTVLKIKTGHKWVNVVVYSPDNEKFATCGDDENAVKIWDAKMGKLITTLKHDIIVWSLAWTLDGKKLISASQGPIWIFDAVTWEQIAVLEGHTSDVRTFSLSPNNRLLASASWDKTARLWNLDTNLQIGPPLQHETDLESAALSADGKVLVTGCTNGNVYTWDIHAIIKQAGPGLEDLLLPIYHVPAPKLLTTSDATRRPAIHARRIPPGFFGGAQSSAAYGTHRPASSSNPRALFSGFSSLFRHKTDGATELQQCPRRSMFSHGPRIVEVAAVRDKKPLFVARRPERNKVKRTQQQQTQSRGQPQASSSETQPAAASTSAIPPDPGTNTTAAGAAPAQPRSLPLWARFVLFLCCASPPHIDGNAKPAQQQQGQSQDVQAQASSSQTQLAAALTSMTPTALDTRPTAPGATSA